MTINRQYDEMLRAAVARLRGIDIWAAAERAGMQRAGEGLAFTSFGRQIRLDARDFHVEPALDLWHHLSLLQVLEGADGRTPSEEWIGLAELPGGMVRGASFDREIDRLLAEGLSGFGEDALRAACARLGGVMEADGRADLCARFDFAPRVPLRLSLWLSDDEFPASGHVKVNAAARRALGVEAAGTVAVLLVRLLADAAGGKPMD